MDDYHDDDDVFGLLFTDTVQINSFMLVHKSGKIKINNKKTNKVKSLVGRQGTSLMTFSSCYHFFLLI